MDGAKKIGRMLYRVYVGIGIVVMGGIAASVIFAVIMRYCFNISFTFLEELITLMFAFSAFWSIGICALEDEHVVIDYFYEKIPKKIRRWVAVFNYIMVAVTMIVITYYSIEWIKVAGKTTSNGMRIRYIYIYGTMPIGIMVSLIPVIYKIICLAKNVPCFAKKEEETDL